MTDKVNLTSLIGIGGGEGQSPFLDWYLDAGCRHFRLDGSDWARANPEENVYNIEHFKKVVDKCYSRGAKVLPNLFTIPAWTDKTQVLIDGWYPVKAISQFKTEIHSSKWVNYVYWWCKQFPNPVCEIVGAPTETNIPNVWRDLNDPRKPRSAEDYMELVIKPAAQILKQEGKKIVAGAPTLRGQDINDFREALTHFRDIRAANDNDVGASFLDIHVYHDKGGEAGKNIVRDLGRFFKYFSDIGKPIKNPIYITETGCNESSAFNWFERWIRNLLGKPDYTGEMNQERNYKPMLEYYQADFLSADPKHAKVYFYEMFDPPSRTKDFNGLVRLARTGDPDDRVFSYPEGKVFVKKAGMLIREYWQA